jgi:hypothetical protein
MYSWTCRVIFKRHFQLRRLFALKAGLWLVGACQCFPIEINLCTLRSVLWSISYRRDRITIIGWLVDKQIAELYYRTLTKHKLSEIKVIVYNHLIYTLIRSRNDNHHIYCTSWLLVWPALWRFNKMLSARSSRRFRVMLPKVPSRAAGIRNINNRRKWP